MKTPRTHVTDHAVLRYLERVVGLDIEGLRRQIGHDVDRAADLGACATQIDGWRYCLAYDHGRPVVTTVRHPGTPNIRAGYKRGGT